MKNRTILLVILILAVIAAGCASDGDDGAAATTTMGNMDMDHGDDMDSDHGDETFSFGDPMEGATPDTVIEITANDDFTFTPAFVNVKQGETVTFRITNDGKIPHDFLLGDEEAQDEHEAEMMEMSGDMAMHDEPNAVVLEPGETKEMTWHMTQAGIILFGCHQPGHYGAGMKGNITISP